MNACRSGRHEHRTGGDADVDLGVAGLASAAGLVERLHELLGRCDRDQAVTDAAGELGPVLPPAACSRFVACAIAPSTAHYKRRLPLSVQPGVEMVGDGGVAEADLLGTAGVADEIGGGMLLTR